MSTVVMMTSGKGGVGKSTATASLAMALCRLNKKSIMCGYGSWVAQSGCGAGTGKSSFI